MSGKRIRRMAMRIRIRPGTGDNPSLLRIGHYAYWAALAGILSAISQDALGNPQHGLAHWLFSVPAMAWFAGMIIDFTYHTGRLCELCARLTPADPQAAARRWMPALRLAHGRAKYLLLAALLLKAAADGIVGQGTATLAIDAILLLAVAGLVTCLRRHSRLQPWCPWCNWGHGGEEEISPCVPVPTQSK